MPTSCRWRWVPTLLVVLVVTAGLQPAVGASDESPGGDAATPYVIGGTTDTS